MSVLSEQWLQDVADSMGLPALNPTIVNMLLPVIEVQLKKITQQANKFQRRAKSKVLSVEDVNSALAMNRIEPVYGLSNSEQMQFVGGSGSEQTSSAQSAASSSKQTTRKLVNLVEYAKSTTPISCPLKPEIALHWLAVNGSQPLIAENPSVVSAEAEQQPLSLPRELQHLYARIVGIILSASPTGPTVGLPAVLKVLRTDTGIQELTPYLSRCFYQQIRSNNRRLVLLSTIISAIKALLGNRAVDLEFHLQQLLPAVFTCVVAAKLSSSASEDHWSLRSAAADVIADIGAKFSGQFPELHARICKTYLDALAEDKALPTVYGAIVGLCALGNSIVRSVLLPQLGTIQARLQAAERECGGGSSACSDGTVSGGVNPVAVIAIAGSVDPRVKVEVVTGGSESEGGRTAASTASSSSAGANASKTAGAGAGAKRKRGASIDGTEGAAANASAVASTASSAMPPPQDNTTTAASSAAASKESGRGKFTRAGAAKVMQQQVAVGMCREALLRAIGKYIAYSTRLPDLGQGIGFGRKAGKSAAQQRMPLCDLEEALVPYYASSSKEDYYCRLLI